MTRSCEDDRMTDSPDQPLPRDDRPDERAARAARLNEVFGDVLPETTSDEREDGSARDSADRDEWFRANRPPHH